MKSLATLFFIILSFTFFQLSSPFQINKNVLIETKSLEMTNTKQLPFENKWVQIFIKSTGFCASFNAVNSNILQATCADADPKQLWKLKKNGNSYQIVSRVGDYAWDMAGNHDHRAPFVTKAISSSGNDQFFNIIKVEGQTDFWSIVNPANQRCASYPGYGKLGDFIGQWNCENNDGYYWGFKVAPIEEYPFENQWVQIFVKSTGFCAAFNAANSNILQATCSDTDPNHFWKVTKIGNFYQIISNSGDYAWDMAGNYDHRAPYVTKAISSSSIDQIFDILKIPEKTGLWSIVNTVNQRCASYPGYGKLGDYIGQWNCEINDGYYWGFKPAYTVRGQIKSATTDTPIVANNLSVTFKLGDRSYPAIIQNNSNYQVFIPLKGEYTVEIQNKGYGNFSQKKEFNDNATANFFLSPELVGWRMILTWPPCPKGQKKNCVTDLDAKLKLPDGATVYWEKPKNGNISLDLDSRNGGLETLTMTTHDYKGIYKFFVKNYSNENPLNVSGAKVQLYKNDDMVLDISVPTDAHSEKAQFWNVFHIDGDSKEFKVTNKIAENII
jgi:uncharacterized protein YfaP (DUF2135 family)